MEDQTSVEKLPAVHIARPASRHVQFLGLFDGHGGAACAAFAAERLHVALAASQPFQNGDVGSGLTEAFAVAEAAFLSETESPSGSCALVCVVGGGALHVAHCGDSRAVLATASASGTGSCKAIELTQDHKPDCESERRRIAGMGGSVVIGGRCARVTHSGTSMMLATSRSLGDRSFKESWEAVAAADAVERALDAHKSPHKSPDGSIASNSSAPAAGSVPVASCEVVEAAAEAVRRAIDDDSTVTSDAATESAALAAAAAAREALRASIPPLLSPIPTVFERLLSPEDRFLILACDGVWDVLSNQQAVDIVQEALLQPNATADHAARKLAVDAYTSGSEDNISVLVCVLRHSL